MPKKSNMESSFAMGLLELALFFNALIKDLFRNLKALELLVEKSMTSGNQNLSPGEALRRVLECISSGILMPSKYAFFLVD